MRYSEAKYGRVFVIRLEDGDILHRQKRNLCVLCSPVFRGGV